MPYRKGYGLDVHTCAPRARLFARTAALASMKEPRHPSRAHIRYSAVFVGWECALIWISLKGFRLTCVQQCIRECTKKATQRWGARARFTRTRTDTSSVDAACHSTLRSGPEGGRRFGNPRPTELVTLSPPLTSRTLTNRIGLVSSHRPPQFAQAPDAGGPVMIASSWPRVKAMFDDRSPNLRSQNTFSNRRRTVHLTTHRHRPCVPAMEQARAPAAAHIRKYRTTAYCVGDAGHA